jgi:AraC-like DNA-binding protein
MYKTKGISCKMFYLNAQSSHRQIVLANSHYYRNSTNPLYIDRTLQYHDIIYLVDGSWLFTEEEQDYHLKKDDVLLLSAEHHHYTRLPCTPKTRTFCIHVSNEPGDIDAHSSTLSLPKHIHVGNNPSIKKYFEKIVATFWSNNPHKQERMMALFHLMALDLADIHENTEQPLSTLMCSINHFIANNAYKRLTAKEVADQFSLSAKTVEHVLQTNTGMSFAKYQMQRKLEMVASLIDVEPDMRLSEMAELFGFCDEFHLSHAFKRKYGVSPTKYKFSEK